MPRPTQPVLALAAALMLSPPFAAAQRATPVSHLDLNQFTGTWYQIARLPDKPEKKCKSDGMILYALSDKPRSFQQGLFCKIKGGDAQYSNSSGKQSKTGTGELKVPRLFIFSTKYEVLATDPAYTWALVGTTNHKSLWLLSRTPKLDPAIHAQLESTATSSGYKTEKLITVPHTVATYRAEQGAPTGQGKGQPTIQGVPSSTTP